jgi:hypothetical protein
MAVSHKNHPTMTKFELDLHNLMMYSYTKFELNVCHRSRIMNGNHLWNDGMTEWRNDGMSKGNTICPRPFHGGGIKILNQYIILCKNLYYTKMWIFIAICSMDLILMNFKMCMFCHYGATVTSKHNIIAIHFTHFQNCLPVRIRVRIDPPHSLVCRRRRLNRAVLPMRLEKPRSRVTAGVAQ